jgi:hypothetical protein
VDRHPFLVVSAPLNPCILPTPSLRRSLKVSKFSVFLCDNSSPHFEYKDDGHGGSRTFSRGMSDHRRDTSLTTTPTLHGDPTSKIWGLYLSQAEKIDKEHSESWTANTDGVLVFVRHFSSHQILLFLPRRPRPVFSPPWSAPSSLSVIRCYSPVQPIPPINCLPESPNNYQQVGQTHSHCLLSTHHFNLALLPCV